MGVEIERKFLVTNDTYKDMAYSISHIKQGYLNRNPDRTVRVRVRDDHGYLTVKGRNQGDTRLEFEYDVPRKDAEEMLLLCENPILDKSRYLVKYEGFIWEIDEFHGRLSQLVVAEIELPASDTKFTLPPFIGKEVTGDPRYYNSSL